MSDIVVVEEIGATVVVQETAPANTVEVVAQGPQGAQGAAGAQGVKGDTGDITPELLAAKVAAEAAATGAAGSASAASGSATSAASSATAASSSASSASGSATAASNSATAASGSASTAATKASEASASASNAATSASTASTKASEAATSSSNAATSATAAGNSATSASTSAGNAATSAATATTKASEAQTSATNASTSATTATTKAAEASTSASNAAGSATSASNSAATATTKASEASTSATNAAASAATATTKASEASTSASNAATSVTSAATSASAANASATSAAASATTATTKASEAQTSATNAGLSATTAGTQASAASTSASNAATSATSAATSATNSATSATAAAGSASAASTSATNASGSASTATTQAGIATTQASNAATSATNAATSASGASTSASNASTSAIAAASAKAAAESARDQTLAAFDSFDDRYLGSKSSDPTVDNDGNALVSGALYFNTAAMGSGGGMKVYDGTVWLAAYASLSGALLSANNLSDLASASAARTNLSLGNVENKSSSTIRGEISSSNVTAALGFTPANAATLATVATSGSYADLINKPTLFSGAYADLSGKPSLFSGAYVDLTGKPTLFSGAYSDLTGKPTNVSTFTNDAAYLTGITSTQVTTALGFTPYNATNPSGYITSSALTPYLSSATAASTYQTVAGMSSYLTTSSAASTYQPLDGDLTSIAGLAGTTGILKKTAANTWALDTSTYLTTSTAASTYLTQANASSTYLTTSVASNTYLPLAGGTLTGKLTAKTPSFSIGGPYLNFGLYQSASGPSRIELTDAVAGSIDGDFWLEWYSNYSIPSAKMRANATTYTIPALTGYGTAGQTIVSGGVTAAAAWGTLGVAGGGTGAITLTGLVKGNGTSAFTAAVAGTDYVVPSALSSYLTTASAASTYQVGLVSGTNIKTVNSQSILGSGNIQIDGGVTSFNTRTGAITLSSGDVTTALGFTPYNATNPTGYITSSALSGYLTTSTAASTYLPLAGGSLTGNLGLAGSPTSWASNGTLDLSNNLAISGYVSGAVWNVYYNGGWKYKTNGLGTAYLFGSDEGGHHSWYNVANNASGGGAAATLNRVMRMTSAGNLLINTSTDDGANKLQVNGNTALTGNLSLSGTATLSGGTANGVAYLNGSKVLTSGSALTFDGNVLSVTGTGGATAFNLTDSTSNIGLGATPASGGGFYLSNYRVGSPIYVRTSNASTADVTAMTFLSSGNVGIGTSSPTSRLYVGASSGKNTATINGGSTNSGDGAELIIANGGTTYGGIGNYSGVFGGAYDNTMAVHGYWGLRFFTTAAERMRIDSSGNVGIGTSSPAAKLDVAGLIYSRSPSAGQIASLAAANDGTTSLTSYNGTGAAIAFVTSNTSGINVERARISSAGGFAVGTTADPGAGAIFATGNITAYYSSDRKFKENVRDIPDALGIATRIGSKLFDWTDEYIKEHGGADDYFMRKEDFGVIAQDVIDAGFPQAVRTRPDGSLAVDYEKLGVLSFGALRELAARVEALEAK